MTEALSAWSAERIERQLRERGVWSGPAPTVRVLSGGVSGTVLRLDGPDRSLVLKQALAELDVPDVWQADPRRILTEAAALRTLHVISPEHVPAVVDCDEAQLLLVMQAAPTSWHTWKEQLLAGQPAEASHRVAASLGHQMRHWHQATTAAAWPAAAPDRARFAPTDDFTALRVDPFYRRVADQYSGRVADRLHQLADGLLAAETCLVHGDLSPKNLLRPAGLGTDWWLVDSECATLGDPVFDVAFLLTHLVLKSLDPGRSQLRAVAQECWRTYCEPEVLLSEAQLVAHCAALMLARVDGVSTVGYLTPAQADLVRRQATRALLEETGTLTGYLDLIGEDGSAG